MSYDHSPDDHDEAKRIKKSGGVVIENSLGVAHVNGRLTMTRSIGDVELKSFGVTAEPYIRSIRVRKMLLYFVIVLFLEKLFGIVSHANVCKL